ncbi:cytochrome c-type biogenesis protein CcmE [Catalinimonas alkaloidigena]|uniref:Cytochrome c-type biogenesis protein CcmE n=1 Tax=Catalinimonas alkaloidigena TaxID=1075417 RepID=A0A1G9F2K8_9BACT|nr:cytochrome c maturation protein CcmE [Catalinimonas alkaloidigena]SDK82473.1 cytochrome c-type biogenesis protein CcmE [Catalinimonas alkaloidigena]
MKKAHLLGIVIIAVAVGIIISTAGDASTYVSFQEAATMAANGRTEKIHVVGELQKDPQGHFVGMQYQPELDPNFFTFSLVDDQGKAQQVIYHNPMPQDFEKSEKIVIIGGYQNDVFVADKILMKCPSKYQDDEFREVPQATAPQAQL